MQVHEVEIQHNHGWPTTITCQRVVEKQMNGQRPVQKNWAKQPQAGQCKTRRHAKLTTSSEHLLTGAAVLGRIAVRHRHRTPVSADKGGLQTRKLALGQLVPRTNRMAKPRRSERVHKHKLGMGRDRTTRANTPPQGGHGLGVCTYPGSNGRTHGAARAHIRAQVDI